mmetsp:Transcript_92912/g.206690  ORF Transcript_92912/g.206690 Transcript_92912/m.206690 type:complete len:152 (-) Transcript_92912:227-682(-)
MSTVWSFVYTGPPCCCRDPPLEVAMENIEQSSCFGDPGMETAENARQTDKSASAVGVQQYGLPPWVEEGGEATKQPHFEAEEEAEADEAILMAEVENAERLRKAGSRQVWEQALMQEKRLRAELSGPSKTGGLALEKKRDASRLAASCGGA